MGGGGSHTSQLLISWQLIFFYITIIYISLLYSLLFERWLAPYKSSIHFQVPYRYTRKYTLFLPDILYYIQCSVDVEDVPLKKKFIHLSIFRKVIYLNSQVGKAFDRQLLCGCGKKTAIIIHRPVCQNFFSSTIIIKLLSIMWSVGQSIIMLFKTIIYLQISYSLS